MPESRFPRRSPVPPARGLAAGFSLGLALLLGAGPSPSFADPLPEDMAVKAEALDANIQDIKNQSLGIYADGLALEESVDQPAWQRATFYLGVTQPDFVIESARLVIDGAEVVATREFSLKESYSLDSKALFKLTTATMPLGPHRLRLEYVGHRRPGAASDDGATSRLMRLPVFSLFGLSRQEQREADEAQTARTRGGVDTQRYPASRTRGPQPFIQGAVEGVFEKTAEPVDLEISLGWDKREARVGGNVIVWRPGK